MPRHITPSLGIGINNKIYNSLEPTKQAPIGTVVKGDDGHDYIYASASGAVAPAAVVILTETVTNGVPAYTVATGAGAWTHVGATALAAADKAWFKKTAF